jgi:G3E family GTPase
MTFDRQRLSLALARLPDSIIRAKGLFYCTNDHAERYVYQKVGRRYSLMPESHGDTGQHVSSFVAIAPAATFDTEQIASIFADCIAEQVSG